MSKEEAIKRLNEILIQMCELNLEAYELVFINSNQQLKAEDNCFIEIARNLRETGRHNPITGMTLKEEILRIVNMKPQGENQIKKANCCGNCKHKDVQNVMDR